MHYHQFGDEWIYLRIIPRQSVRGSPSLVGRGIANPMSAMTRGFKSLSPRHWIVYIVGVWDFAPRPYTVSVGNATRFPDFIILEACLIFEICGLFELILRIFVCIFAESSCSNIKSMIDFLYIDIFIIPCNVVWPKVLCNSLTKLRGYFFNLYADIGISDFDCVFETMQKNTTKSECLWVKYLSVKPIKILDYSIFVLILIFSILLLIDYGFLKISDHSQLENIKKTTEIILGILVSLFILDLSLKYRKSENWRVFLKKNWFDIITLALIPIFSTMKMLKIVIPLVKKLKILKMFTKIIYKSKKLTK